MKAYVIKGFSIWYPESDWIHDTIYMNRLAADKMAYSLAQESIDEESGEYHRYKVYEYDLDETVA